MSNSRKKVGTGNALNCFAGCWGVSQSDKVQSLTVSLQETPELWQALEGLKKVGDLRAGLVLGSLFSFSAGVVFWGEGFGGDKTAQHRPALLEVGDAVGCGAPGLGCVTTKDCTGVRVLLLF